MRQILLGLALVGIGVVNCGAAKNPDLNASLGKLQTSLHQLKIKLGSLQGKLGDLKGPLGGGERNAKEQEAEQRRLSEAEDLRKREEEAKKTEAKMKILAEKEAKEKEEASGRFTAKLKMIEMGKNEIIKKLRDAVTKCESDEVVKQIFAEIETFNSKNKLIKISDAALRKEVLFLLVYCKNKDIANLILKRYGYSSDVKNLDGQTALYCVVKSKNKEKLDAFLNNLPKEEENDLLEACTLAKRLKWFEGMALLETPEIAKKEAEKELLSYVMQISSTQEGIKKFLDLPENIRPSIKHARNEYGCSVLHNAEAKFVKFLVDNGANINAQDDNGNTPLHNAVTSGLDGGADISKAKVLLENGAKIDIKNKSNQTPLEYATSYKNSSNVSSVKKVCDEFIKLIQAKMPEGAKITPRFGEVATPVIPPQDSPKSVPTEIHSHQPEPVAVTDKDEDRDAALIEKFAKKFAPPSDICTYIEQHKSDLNNIPGYRNKGINDFGRIINAERMRRIIQQFKLDRLDVPLKYIYKVDNHWIVLAKEVNAKTRNFDLNLTLDETKQLAKLLEETGYRDFGTKPSSPNILRDTNGKLVFIDTEDSSFSELHNVAFNNPDVQEAAHPNCKAHFLYNLFEAGFLMGKNADDWLNEEINKIINTSEGLSEQPILPKITKFDDPAIDFEQVKKLLGHK